MPAIRKAFGGRGDDFVRTNDSIFVHGYWYDRVRAALVGCVSFGKSTEGRFGHVHHGAMTVSIPL